MHTRACGSAHKHADHKVRVQHGEDGGKGAQREEEERGQGREKKFRMKGGGNVTPHIPVSEISQEFRVLEFLSVVEERCS